MISGRNIEKGFQLGDEWVQALDNVSLDVPEGQFIAIMGPSGSGKSTLLYMLGGLDRPTGGSIQVAGQDVSHMSGEDLARFRRETIGFIFQAFHLVPTLTALENVALPGIFAGLPRDLRENRAIKLLSALSMEDRMDHRPSQLSGGQQQRVAIARALFNNPPIIMADEPTGALDSKTGQTVMRMLRWLCSKQGKTVVIVTHDPGVASYSDRMLNLRDGQITEDRLLAPRNGRNGTKPLSPIQETEAVEKREQHQHVEESKPSESIPFPEFRGKGNKT
jgi:ABC-type lipoprotein export system ATPase subunit